MFSIDMYDRGPQFGPELESALGFVTAEAEKRKKLTALSETGPRRGMSDWWTSVLLPVISKYSICYILTWRHAYRMRPGNQNPPFPPDFMNFYNSTKTLFLKDIQGENIYSQVKNKLAPDQLE
jgi:mannan endo-1,4-beta-mannosidase